MDDVVITNKIGVTVDLRPFTKDNFGDNLSDVVLNIIKNTPKGSRIILPTCILKIEETLIL